MDCQLEPPIPPADLVAAALNAEVEKLIFIECECSPAESVAEAAWVAGLAEAEPRLRGMLPELHWKRRSGTL